MKFKTSLLLLYLVIPYNFQAQTVESSLPVEKNIFQLEIESLYAIQKEGTTKTNLWSIPSALFRYGLFNGFELQLNTPIIKEKLWENEHLIHSLHKFDDVQIGFSLFLWEQHKFLPEAALMIRAILPTDSSFKLNQFGKVISLNLSNTISDKLSLNYNIGCALETDHTKTGFFITNLTYDLNGKIHFFTEYFGDFTTSKLLSTNINVGGGYNFNEQLTFDVTLANGIDHQMYYIGGILTYAFNTKKP